MDRKRFHLYMGQFVYDAYNVRAYNKLSILYTTAFLYPNFPIDRKGLIRYAKTNKSNIFRIHITPSLHN